MGADKWSDKQREVIESRKENLLVSAAAGAGKTSVLVERILRLITDEGQVLIDSISSTGVQAKACFILFSRRQDIDTAALGVKTPGRASG